MNVKDAAGSAAKKINIIHTETAQTQYTSLYREQRHTSYAYRSQSETLKPKHITHNKIKLHSIDCVPHTPSVMTL